MNAKHPAECICKACYHRRRLGSATRKAVRARLATAAKVLSKAAVVAALFLLFATLGNAQQGPAGTAVTNQAVAARALTKSDTATFIPTRGVYVGDAAACNIAVRFFADSAAVTLATVQPGQTYPFSVIQLMSTNTTCTAITALY